MNTSIQTEITNLQNTKKNNRTAILEKGVVVYATDLYSSYPTKISLISMTPGDKDSLLTSLMNETLTEFTIPDGTSVIADGTLTANNSVETLVIPNTVKEIGDGAFQSNNLRTVIIEGDFETVGNRVFYDCQMLQSVTFEEGVTSAGGNLFRECTSLTQVNLPSTLEYIDGFYGCTSLTNST